MTEESFDIVVVGAGVFGLATALEAARRGNAVAVVDRLGTGHPATSSTGRSRGIRIAYDDPFYVELARDAIRRWRLLEAASGRTILHLRGQLDFGSHAKLERVLRAMRAAGAPIEELDESGLVARFPEISVDAAESALFHPDAGTVFADEGLAALSSAARAAGVVSYAPERVTALENGATAMVTTERRVLRADVVVVAAGPWSGELLAPLGLALPLGPALAQVTFFDAPQLLARPGFVEWREGGGAVYGHPVRGIGYKFAFATGQEGWFADATSWAPDREEELRLVEWVAHRFPSIPRAVSSSQRHPWTMTPDGDFIVDRRGALVLACGCSGHAFKFGPALGPLVADIVEGKPVNALFRLDRPALQHRSARAATPISR